MKQADIETVGFRLHIFDAVCDATAFFAFDAVFETVLESWKWRCTTRLLSVYSTPVYFLVLLLHPTDVATMAYC